jgi:hypothetical protein
VSFFGEMWKKKSESVSHIYMEVKNLYFHQFHKVFLFPRPLWANLFHSTPPPPKAVKMFTDMLENVYPTSYWVGHIFLDLPFFKGKLLRKY